MRISSTLSKLRPIVHLKNAFRSITNPNLKFSKKGGTTQLKYKKSRTNSYPFYGINNFITCLANATIYWLFLIPEQNPSIFNCPLPPQYTNQTNVVEVTFTAVENRKVIMWATFTLNNLLIGGCCLTWLFYPKCNSSALRLLRQLPLADNVEIPDSYSDLHFILELVHLNRNRLTFVRFLGLQLIID